jgi:biopolymer transport protein TolQ
MGFKKAAQDDEHFQKMFWSGAELNTLYNNAQLNSKRSGLEDIFYQGLGEFLNYKNAKQIPIKPLKVLNVFFVSV